MQLILSYLQSQQIKAVSSPTLSEPCLEEQPQKGTESTDVANTGSSAGSGGLGVLQKFKRTLNNFNNKNQLHISPLSPAAVGNNAPKTKTSPTTTTASIAPMITTTTASDPGSEAGDTSSGKYRFGPLIWRSSKERRKTKYNRRDKCNSGDSGIQIELEQDEQYSRATMAVSRQDEPRAFALTNGSCGVALSKMRAIRRTNSAKASSILGPFIVKTKIAKHLNIGESDKAERKAPESLPTRSLSQPNGLESYGMGRPDLEDSDSDSVASNEEGRLKLKCTVQFQPDNLNYYGVFFVPSYKLLPNHLCGGALQLHGRRSSRTRARERNAYWNTAQGSWTLVVRPN